MKIIFIKEILEFDANEIYNYTCYLTMHVKRNFK